MKEADDPLEPAKTREAWEKASRFVKAIAAHLLRRT